MFITNKDRILSIFFTRSPVTILHQFSGHPLQLQTKPSLSLINGRGLDVPFPHDIRYRQTAYIGILQKRPSSFSNRSSKSSRQRYTCSSLMLGTAGPLLRRRLLTPPQVVVHGNHPFPYALKIVDFAAALIMSGFVKPGAGVLDFFCRSPASDKGPEKPPAKCPPAPNCCGGRDW